MPLGNLVINKNWFTATTVREVNWDAIRNPLVSWATNINLAINQIKTDAFGASYDINNTGTPQLSLSLQDQINAIVVGSVALDSITILNTTDAASVQLFTNAWRSATPANNDAIIWAQSLNSNTTQDAIQSQILFVATDVTHATRTSAIVLKTMLNGVLTERFRLSGDGSFTTTTSQSSTIGGNLTVSGNSLTVVGGGNLLLASGTKVGIGKAAGATSGRLQVYNSVNNACINMRFDPNVAGTVALAFDDGRYGWLDYETSGGNVRLAHLLDLSIGNCSASDYTTATFTERFKISSSGNVSVATGNLTLTSGSMIVSSGTLETKGVSVQTQTNLYRWLRSPTGTIGPGDSSYTFFSDAGGTALTGIADKTYNAITYKAKGRINEFGELHVVKDVWMENHLTTAEASNAFIDPTSGQIKRSTSSGPKASLRGNTNGAITFSNNITSVVNIAVGHCRITFTTAFASTFYIPLATLNTGGAFTGYIIPQIISASVCDIYIYDFALAASDQNFNFTAIGA